MTDFLHAVKIRIPKHPSSVLLVNHIAVCGSLRLIATTYRRQPSLVYFGPLQFDSDLTEDEFWERCFVVKGGIDAPPSWSLRIMGSSTLGMDVNFGTGGDMTFVEPNLLLVTDCTHHAVHVIDVVARRYAGHLLDPGCFVRPCSITSMGDTVAVGIAGRGSTADKGGPIVEPSVLLFQRTSTSWTFLRRILFSEENKPRNLRFISPSIITNHGLNFCVHRGTYVGRRPVLCQGWRKYPWFPMENVGYMVWETCGFDNNNDALWIVSEDFEKGTQVPLLAMQTDPIADACSYEGGVIYCTSHFVPGFATFLGTREVVRRASMSAIKIAWMGAVIRGVLGSAQHSNHSNSDGGGFGLRARMH